MVAPTFFWDSISQLEKKSPSKKKKSPSKKKASKKKSPSKKKKSPSKKKASKKKSPSKKKKKASKKKSPYKKKKKKASKKKASKKKSPSKKKKKKASKKKASKKKSLSKKKKSPSKKKKSPSKKKKNPSKKKASKKKASKKKSLSKKKKSPSKKKKNPSKKKASKKKNPRCPVPISYEDTRPMTIWLNMALKAIRQTKAYDCLQFPQKSRIHKPDLCRALAAQHRSMKPAGTVDESDSFWAGKWPPPKKESMTNSDTELNNKDDADAKLANEDHYEDDGWIVNDDEAYREYADKNISDVLRNINKEIMEDESGNIYTIYGFVKTMRDSKYNSDEAFMIKLEWLEQYADKQSEVNASKPVNAFGFPAPAAPAQDPNITVLKARRKKIIKE